jgi:putative DNA primase/helicase
VACRVKPSTARSDNEDLARVVRTILRESVPISGTLGAQYLQSRGLDTSDLPACLRFHPSLWHMPSREHWPAMVTPLRDVCSNEVVGVHRTYLARDGSGKAPIEKPRMVLGRMRGACVKLTPNEQVAECLHVAEGAETALRAMQVHNWRPIWCLPANAIANLPVLPGITCLTIAADHDAPGLAAAQACAERWAAAGVEVFVRWPAGFERDYADPVP